MLSIIIPVFNEEQYICSILESIADFRIDDYEVICVDDGSTDGSRDILLNQEILDADKIKVYTINNSGPGYARNFGLEHCNGDHVLFCDADDRIVSKTVEKMYKSICNSSYDIVLCDYKEIYDSGKETIYCYSLEDENDYFALVRSGIAVYAKIYKKDFLVSNKISFNNTYHGEDRVFLGRVLACKPKLSKIEETGYVYYRHETDAHPTLTHCNSYDSFSERIDNWKLFYDICKDIDKKEAKHSIEIVIDYLFRCWLKLPDTEKDPALLRVIELCDHVFDKRDIVKVFGVPLKDFRTLSDRICFSELYVSNRLGRNRMRIASGCSDNNSPLVSVIIPICNTEDYLDSCLSDVLRQSFRDFELILIDDCSNDSSYEIMQIYCNAIPEITLLRNETRKGAGYSRNRGLDLAKGKYILFLDSDDFFDKHLLEKAVEVAENEQLDVLVFNATLYFEDCNGYLEIDNMLNKAYVPKSRPFAGVDADHIFNLSTAAPWNKLFRKLFIEKHDLKYMSLSNSNDVYFVYMALALAERIDVLYDRLVYYRQSPYSTQATKEKAPMCWYEALTALKEGLSKEGIFEKVEKSYLNYVLSFFYYNLTSLKDEKAFESAYSLVHGGGLEKLGIDEDIDESVYDHNEQSYEEYKKIVQSSLAEYMFEKQAYESKARAFYQGEFNRISNSWTYRIGNGITIIPRRLRRWFRDLYRRYGAHRN
ncbi:MAG: glycosyltransferase [Lachnospiraceae bacterium]|nr:glycosyltransferase [Lachnospiraceae bacterium]